MTSAAAAGVFRGLFFLAGIFFLQPKEIWALFVIGSTEKAFWILKAGRKFLYMCIYKHVDLCLCI